MSSKQHNAYKVRTGHNEWGKTYTVYVWDESVNCYRELVSNQLYHQACAAVKESNEARKQAKR